MSLVSFFAYGQSIILLTLTVVAGVASAVATVHAAIQRPDAFPAVDRQSKVMWVSILAVATLVVWFLGIPSFLSIIAIVAVLVYLVDVRPRVDQIQHRRWFRRL